MAEEKRYYWLKLQRDFFKNHKVVVIEGMPNGKDYVLFYLKLLCESIDHEGRLRFSDSIPYREDMLASLTNTNIDTVRSAVKIFTELHLMEVMDDGTLYMSEVQKMIGSAADNANARRQARFRENQRQKMLNSPDCFDENVTNNNASVTDSVTNSNEEYRDKSIEIRDNISSSSKDSEDVVLPPSPKKADKTPYQEIVDLYYELCPNMSKVRPIKSPDKSKIKARWAEYKGDLEAFKTVFINAEASDSLNNRKPGFDFQASFNWLMLKEKFRKTLNGEYNNVEKASTIKGTDIKMPLMADGSDRKKYVDTGWS